MSNDNERYTFSLSDGYRLTPMSIGDKAALIEFLNDRDIYDRTICIPFPYTEESADTFLASVEDATEKVGHPVHFAIRNESNKLIGGFGFDGLSHGHRAEIGYWLARKYWGQGIMTATIRETCAFARAEWQLHRIFAQVFDFNPASARVLEKNGFTCEGLLRNQFRKDGRLISALMYAWVPD